MVGIIIVTHGKLAETFLSTAESIAGRLDNIRCVEVKKADNVDDVRKSISSAIKAVDKGMGVLILTDMFGGTPSNISLSFLEDERIEVLTGLNLPMLLKLSSLCKDNTLPQLAELLKASGEKGIVLASEVLKTGARQ